MREKERGNEKRERVGRKIQSKVGIEVSAWRGEGWVVKLPLPLLQLQLQLQLQKGEARYRRRNGSVASQIDSRAPVQPKLDSRRQPRRRCCRRRRRRRRRARGRRRRHRWRMPRRTEARTLDTPSTCNVFSSFEKRELYRRNDGQWSSFISFFPSVVFCPSTYFFFPSLLFHPPFFFFGAF